MDMIEQVKELVEPYLESHDIELVDIIYRRESSGMVLRLLVDTPSGISINECASLNNFLSEELEKSNIIDERYLIEVSSPGLDRHLKTDRDFERFIERELDVTTYALIDGRRTHSGKLIGMDKENIVIESNGMSVVIPRAGIAKATLKICIERA